MADRIELRGLRVRGHHGVFDFERREGQDFVIDAVLELDLRPAAASDDVRATVDYGLVAAQVVEMCTKQRVNLLERLAVGVAGMLLAEFACSEVRVRVRKLTPPMEGLHATPGVEVTRRR